MEAWQNRVVEEKNSLDDKIEKLISFFGRADVEPIVDDVERIRLLYQLDLMKRYSSVLDDRIGNFSVSSNRKARRSQSTNTSSSKIPTLEECGELIGCWNSSWGWDPFSHNTDIVKELYDFIGCR